MHESLLLKLDSRGETALHLASREGHYDVVEALINKAKSSLVQPDHLQNTSSTVVQLLIRLANVEFETALHAACRNHYNNVVQLLVTQDPSHPHPQNMYGDIHTIVEDLVGADISAAYLADKEYKRTALHIAAYRGNVDVLKELLKYIPDTLEVLDASGRNILHIAVEQDQKEVIRFLLSQGDKAINKLLIQRDKEGNTPLHLIAKFECYVQELMNLSTLDWEVLNNSNLTPLDLLDCTLPDQISLSHKNRMIRNRLVDDLGSRQHWYLWRTLKDPDGLKLDIEKGTKIITHKEKMNKEAVEFYNKIINTHMIVAALIVTVALTAGFAMPGGFDGNEGPKQGSAVLVRKTAFRAFIVTDSIALLFSISSLFLYFNTPFYQNADVLGNRNHGPSRYNAQPFFAYSNNACIHYRDLCCLRSLNRPCH